jgi:hypothetical protein
VFESRVLRRIFPPKRDEVTGGWRKLYNEDVRFEVSTAVTMMIIIFWETASSPRR